MKILVTGATGFVGSYVVKELLKTNHQIFASGIEPLQELNASWLSDVTYFPCDVARSEKNLFDYFHQPDILIHLAWEGLPNYNELFHVEKNLPNQYFFLKNIIEHGLRKLTVTGTCFEYGMKEGCLNEEMNADPANSYGLAKDSLRKFLMLLKQNNFDFQLNWMRLFYIYGKGQSQQSLYTQLLRAISCGDDVFNMSTGDQIRDFLSVEEVAKNIVHAALSKNDNGIINCCSGNPISVKSFVEKIISEENAKINLNLGFYSYPAYEPFAFWGDNKKLMNIIHERTNSD